MQFELDILLSRKIAACKPGTENFINHGVCVLTKWRLRWRHLEVVRRLWLVCLIYVCAHGGECRFDSVGPYMHFFFANFYTLNIFFILKISKLDFAKVIFAKVFSKVIKNYCKLGNFLIFNKNDVTFKVKS